MVTGKDAIYCEGTTHSLCINTVCSSTRTNIMCTSTSATRPPTYTPQKCTTRASVNNSNFWETFVVDYQVTSLLPVNIWLFLDLTTTSVYVNHIMSGYSLYFLQFTNIHNWCFVPTSHKRI